MQLTDNEEKSRENFAYKYYMHRSENIYFVFGSVCARVRCVRCVHIAFCRKRGRRNMDIFDLFRFWFCEFWILGSGFHHLYSFSYARGVCVCSVFMVHAMHWFWLLATSVYPDVVVHFMNLMRRCNFYSFFLFLLFSSSFRHSLTSLCFFFLFLRSVVFAVKCGSRHSHEGFFRASLFCTIQPTDACVHVIHTDAVFHFRERLTQFCKKPFFHF